jgi:hypothetical protein
MWVGTIGTLPKTTYLKVYHCKCYFSLRIVPPMAKIYLASFRFTLRMHISAIEWTWRGRNVACLWKREFIICCSFHRKLIIIYDFSILNPYLRGNFRVLCRLTETICKSMYSFIRIFEHFEGLASSLCSFLYAGYNDLMGKCFKGYSFLNSIFVVHFPPEGALETCRILDTSIVVTIKQSGIT